MNDVDIGHAEKNSDFTRSKAKFDEVISPFRIVTILHIAFN